MTDEPKCKNPACENGIVPRYDDDERTIWDDPCPDCNPKPRPLSGSGADQGREKLYLKPESWPQGDTYEEFAEQMRGEAPSGAEDEASLRAGHSSAVSGASPSALCVFCNGTKEIRRSEEPDDVVPCEACVSPSALDDALVSWVGGLPCTDFEIHAAKGFRAGAEWATGQASQGWQPIETAPKDEIEFQAWVVNGRGVGFWEPKCRYNEDGSFEIWGRIDYDQDGWEIYSHLTATHWMPLPAPPNGESHE